MRLKKYICLLLTIVFASGISVYGGGEDSTPLAYNEATTTSQAVEAAVNRVYADISLNDWYVADMAADGVVTAQMREYISTWYDRNKIRLVTDAERLLIAEAAVGIRDEELADYVCENTKNAGINGLIFGLLALDSYGYDRPEARQRLISDLLASQNDMGGFGASEIIDTDMTAYAVCALAPYKECEEAVERAVEALKSKQVNGGAFENNYGQVNSNSTAAVITALCAADVPMGEDSAFNKEGTPLEGLLQFKNEDNTFGFVSAKYNGLATEQAFRALVAIRRSLSGESRVYLFRFNKGEAESTTQTTTESTTQATTESTTQTTTESVTQATMESTTQPTTESVTQVTTESTTQPTTESVTQVTTENITQVATGSITESTTAVSETTTGKSPSGSGGSGGSGKRYINVRVGVSTYAENVYYFDFETNVSVKEGASAWTALKKALDEKGLVYGTTGDDEDIYLYGVGESDGNMLSEFDMGENSGWMYSVNGIEPEISMGGYRLEGGDAVSLYYVSDYAKKSSDSSDSDNNAQNSEKIEEKFDALDYLTSLTRGIITDIIFKRVNCC